MAARSLPLVIVNPASRGGAGGHDWPHVASTLRSHFGPFEHRFTEWPGHATALARNAGEAGYGLVVAFGGDGTISEVASGIVMSGHECTIGILPHGTGSDLARSLGLPSRLGDAVRLLRSGRAIAIDVGRVTLADGTVRRFVNAASFGLSAEVAALINRSRRGYVRETLSAALAFRPVAVELSLDGRPRRRLSITTVSLHNGRFFGGGMEMAPEAHLDDGRLDVVVVKKLPVRKLLTRAPLLYWGAHQGLAEVEHGRLDRLDAWPVAGDVPLEIDGESGYRLPASFEVEPRRLRVLTRPANPWNP